MILANKKSIDNDTLTKIYHQILGAKYEFTFTFSSLPDYQFVMQADDIEQAIDDIADYLDSTQIENLQNLTFTIEDISNSKDQKETVNQFMEKHNLIRCGTKALFMEMPIPIKQQMVINTDELLEIEEPEID